MMSASRALRKINQQAATGVVGQQQVWGENRVMSPEMRAVRQHHVYMGLDDAKRLMRTDPRQHAFGCRCALCDTAERPCPIEGCAAAPRGAMNLARHLERHKVVGSKAQRDEKRARAQRIDPVGLGFVAALLGDADRAAHMDLRALRAFEEKIAYASGRRRGRHGAVTRARLEEALKAPLEKSYFRAPLPNSMAAVILRLAVLAAVSPEVVVVAMIAWGIDKFAEDLGKSRIVNEPHIPKKLLQPKEISRPENGQDRRTMGIVAPSVHCPLSTFGGETD